MAPSTLLLLLLAQAAQPPAPTPVVVTQAPQRQTENQTTKPDPPVVRDPTTVTNAPAVRIQRENPSPGTQAQDPEALAEWWTSDRANWTIAVLTFVLAVIAGLQVRLAYRSNQHFRAVERAYVLVTEMNINGELDNAIVEVTVTNTGNTPAKIKRTAIGTLIAEPSRTFPVEMPQLERTDVRTLVVGKNRTAHWGSQMLPLTAGETAALKDGAFIFVLGTVWYDDFFGAERFTNFTHAWEPGMRDSDGKQVWNVVPGGYNDAT